MTKNTIKGRQDPKDCVYTPQALAKRCIEYCDIRHGLGETSLKVILYGYDNGHGYRYSLGNGDYGHSVICGN